MACGPITLAPSVHSRGVPRLPGAVEQRKRAMTEDVEESANRSVPKALPLGDVQQIRKRKGTLRPGESEKVDRHLGRRGSCTRRSVHGHRIERLKLARRERHLRIRAEAHDLGGRIAEVSDRSAIGEMLLQKLHRLEEPERVRL